MSEEKIYVVTPKMTCRFESVTRPYKPDENAKSKYNITAFCDINSDEKGVVSIGEKNQKMTMREILTMLKKQVNAYYKKKKGVPASFLRAYGKGDDKVDAWGDIMLNTFWIKCATLEEYGITVIDNRKKVVEKDQIKDVLYPGCRVKIKFSVRIYDNSKYNVCGIALDLSAIQIVGAGTVINSTAALTGFDEEEYEGEEDPFANFDEPAPF